jgi:hypothetical protein
MAVVAGLPRPVGSRCTENRFGNVTAVRAAKHVDIVCRVRCADYTQLYQLAAHPTFGRLGHVSSFGRELIVRTIVR